MYITIENGTTKVLDNHNESKDASHTTSDFAAEFDVVHVANALDAEADQLGDNKAECWKFMCQQLGWIFCETSRRLPHVLSVYGER